MAAKYVGKLGSGGKSSTLKCVEMSGFSSIRVGHVQFHESILKHVVQEVVYASLPFRTSASMPDVEPSLSEQPHVGHCRSVRKTVIGSTVNLIKRLKADQCQEG
jgi:hypothetical protein